MPAQHVIGGMVSETLKLKTMMLVRDTEKAPLQEHFERAVPVASVSAHATPLRRYEEKIGKLRDALLDPAVKADAVAALWILISRVVVTPEHTGVSMTLEVAMPILPDFADTTNAPR